MKKIIEYFKKDGVALILVSLLTLTCLPQILDAFMMIISKSYLTNLSMATIDLISYVITYLIYILGISKYLESKNKYVDNLISGLPISIGYGVILLLSYLVNIFGLDNYTWFNIVHLIINGIILTISIILGIDIISNKKFNVNSKSIISLILISVIIYIIPEVVSGLLTNNIGNNLFVGTLLIGVIYSILVWIFTIISINIIDKNTDNKSLKVSKLFLITTMVILLALLFALESFEDNNVKKINNMISYSFASGDYAFDQMDIVAAKQFYVDGANIKCAYEYAVDHTINTSNCDSDLLNLFKILNDDNAIVILKDMVNNKKANKYDIESLMLLLKGTNDPELSKLVNYSISQMMFKRTTVLPYDLDEKDIAKLKDDLPKYNEHIIVRRYIDIYEEWLKQGKLNDSVISVANKIALENPDSLGLQANTLKLYFETQDSISGSSNVVDNFVKLTKDKVSEKDVINYKTYVVLAYQKCNANDKVVKFLEEYKPDVISADLGSLLVKTYKKSGKYEDAYNEALKVVKIDKYNVDALGFLSIYTLQSDLEESISYALDLAKIVEDKKDNYLGAEISLNLYKLYLYGNYNTLDSRFAPYKNFYKELTDEQKEKLTSNEIIYAHLIGSSLTKDNIEIINNTIKKYDYASYFYYYRAIYEMKNEDYRNAVSDINKAIELGNNNPFFYSELGFAYEGVGDLKKSLEAFEKASNLIDEYNLGSITYNYNSIHNYFNVYINNAKHALYESEGEH